MTVRPRVVGVVALVLGCGAFWIALPPVAARSAVWPLVVGLLGLTAAAWAVLKRERRVGWIAIVVCGLGIAGGILATHSSVTNLQIVVTWSALTAATLRFATPLAFASLGGMFSERSGVVNIGLEGMMLMGAFFGVWGADKTGTWVGGVVVAMVAGGALALVHALFAIHLRADQIVTGTAVNFLALGITGFLYVKIYATGSLQGTPTNLPEIPDVHLGFLEKVPPHAFGSFLFRAFGDLNLMIWLSVALLFITYVALFRTPIGLRIRAVGEHPRAADTVGISVYRVRYAAVTLSGVLAALGGAYLSLGNVHSFTENMTAGRGFIALAALIFGGWRPFGAYGACVLFGFSSALSRRLPSAYGASAGTLFEALPYVLTLIAVAGVIGRSIPPAAIGRPYKKQ
ncbi:MAG: ral nucleoside transport system permease protein [Gaiellaceae bacterium]|nr:ral nucleoside transport system permease protein [Gaiellaceae bacterium]